MGHNNFFSWKIVSDNIVQKRCDKSVFKYNCSGIPMQVRSFFEIQKIKSKSNINLELDGSLYSAYCQICNKRTRIIWEKQFTKSIEKHSGDHNLILEFCKINSDYYKVTVVSQDTSIDQLLEENDQLESYVVEKQLIGNKEGKRIAMYVTKYERNKRNRELAIKIHGTTCQACGFNFETFYGIQGKNYIEVHHIKPLYDLEKEVEIDPKTDLICICSNCHRMIHRRRDSVIRLEELREMIRNNCNE